jgi:4-amino-4-deoxy-L-arabinose transferase-like glycosyltransferase
MSLSKYSLSFIGLLLFHLVILILLISDYSISFEEADFYYNTNNMLSYIINFSTTIFGQNDIALRLPFIFFYIGSSILLYLLTDDYFRSHWDRLITLSIFMILPGVNSAALLVNESIIVIFCTLLYLYLYKVNQKEYYILLVLFLFIDNSFAILFLALFFYSLKKKDNMLLIVSLALFGVSMSVYGFDISGKPRGYLLDTFGMYASIFSPLIFLYFFYSMYRVGLKYEKDMYWYIAMTSLGLSLLFSMRQHVKIEDFAPFVVIAIPITVKLFMHSLRVRLKEFRKVHYIIASLGLGILFINFIVFTFNKYLYYVVKKPKSHFAYKYHIAKDLAVQLKALGVKKLSTKDERLALRLKFYGIENGDEYYLSRTQIPNLHKIINIEYYEKNIAKFYLANLKDKKKM